MRAEAWMLEVRSRWDGTVVQTRHFKEGQEASVGSQTGWFWSLCGIQMGWVPKELAPLLAVSPPLLSDVRAQVRGDFLVSSDEVEGEQIIGGGAAGAFTIRVPMAWGLEVLEDYESVSIDELLQSGRARRHGDELELEIGRETIAGFSIGELDFEVRLVRVEETVWRGVPAADRWTTRGINTGALAMIALLSFFFANAPRPAFNVELLEEPDLRRYIYINKPEVEDPEPEAILEQPKGPGGAGAPGAPSEAVADVAAEPGTPAPSASLQAVKSAGVLPGLDQMLDTMMGTASLEASVSGIHKIAGAGIGLPGGNGLGGRRGFDGGHAEGLGIGFGPPGGGKPGFGGGGGHPSGGKKPTAMFKADTSNRVIMGPALKASLIDDVIKRYYRQIKYCYQKQMQRDPSLAGKVTVKFTIAGDGGVSKASVASSTLGNKTVESCVVQRFQKMTFPKPKGGGIVIVKYPFVFSPG